MGSCSGVRDHLVTIAPSNCQEYNLRAMVVRNPRDGEYELLELRCSFGTGIVRAVLYGRVDAATALFQAHHQGPRCSPTSSAAPVQGGRGQHQVHTRLTPDRICGSAWWIGNGRPERHAWRAT